MQNIPNLARHRESWHLYYERDGMPSTRRGVWYLNKEKLDKRVEELRSHPRTRRIVVIHHVVEVDETLNQE